MTNDDWPAWRQRAEELRRQLNAHPGYMAYLEWRALRKVHYIFQRNLHDLRAVLSAATEPKLAMELMQNVRPPEVRDAFLRELDRQLHNFVAAVGTLIDHTRNLVKKYSGTPFAKEYDSRRTKVIEAPIATFIWDLRNYLLHHELPFVGQAINFDLDKGQIKAVQAEFSFHVPSLLRWEGWKTKAKAYLKSAGETIDLAQTIRQYSAFVEDLYSWLFGQFESMHGEDWKKARMIDAELSAIFHRAE